MAASVVSVSKNAIAGGAVTVTAPATISAGNLLVAVQFQDSDAANGGAASVGFATMSGATGWTERYSSSAVSNLAGYGKIFTKTATGSEPSTYSFAGSSTATNYVQILNVSGANTSSPFSAAAVYSRPTAASTTSLVAPTVTLSSAGVLVRGYDLQGATSTSTIATPATYTGTSSVDPGNYQLNLVVYKAGQASGAAGTQAATSSTAGQTASAGYLTVSFAIADAGVTNVTGAVTSTITASGTVAAPAATTASFVDNFSTTDTVKWSGYPDTNKTIVSGQLNIVPTTGYPSQLSQASYNLTGSYALINIASLPNVGNGTTQAWPLQLRLDGNNIVQWLFTGGVLIADYVTAGAGTALFSVGFSATYSWVRIRESGGVVYWDHSPDGVTWTNDASTAIAWDKTQLGYYLAAGYYGTEPSPGVMILDNLNLPPVAGNVTGNGTAGAALTGVVGRSGDVSGTATAVAVTSASVGSSSGTTGIGVAGHSVAGRVGVNGTVTGTAVAGSAVGSGKVSGVTGPVSASSTVAGATGLQRAVTVTMTSQSTVSGVVGARGSVSANVVAGSALGTTYIAGTTQTGTASGVVSGSVASSGLSGAVTSTSSANHVVSGFITKPSGVNSSTAAGSLVVGAVGPTSQVAGVYTASSSVSGAVTIGSVIVYGTSAAGSAVSGTVGAAGAVTAAVVAGHVVSGVVVSGPVGGVVSTVSPASVTAVKLGLSGAVAGVISPVFASTVKLGINIDTIAGVITAGPVVTAQRGIGGGASGISAAGAIVSGVVLTGAEALTGYVVGGDDSGPYVGEDKTRASGPVVIGAR